MFPVENEMLSSNSLSVIADGKKITLRFASEAQEDAAERVIEILTESYLDQLFIAPKQ